MKMTMGEDIECPFCGKIFLEESEIEVYKDEGKLSIHCSGCGASLEVRGGSDGKIYI